MDLLSIVVPCFNEAESVESFYGEVQKELEGQNLKSSS